MKDDFLLINTVNLNRDISTLSFNDNYPSKLNIWNSNSLELDEGYTHFGFVFNESIQLKKDNRVFDIYENMYFSVADKAQIIGLDKSIGFVVSRKNYKGFFNIGGPIENKGRYKYIDGCSDSLLISPVSFGDPCLNLLYFPENVNQTPHTHPSIRVGIIVKGEGSCILSGKKISLKKGQVFIINSDILHSFNTLDSDMIIVVYHPESDFGPTNNNHPMINKTIINGISAAKI